MLFDIMLWLIIILLVFISYRDYRPYIDKTSNGSIIFWYNWKGERIYKYLWKRNM